MRELVLGENERHAKFAAKFFAFSQEKETVCVEVVDVSAPSPYAP